MTKRDRHITLGDVAEVRSGLVLARKQALGISAFAYKLLTLRSIHLNGYVDVKQLDVFHAAENLQLCYLSQVGDVIIRLSAPYTAVFVDESTAGMVVSSNFVIIRADRNELLPEYLFWLLNTPKVKRSIYENATSNMLVPSRPNIFPALNCPCCRLPSNSKLPTSMLWR